MGPCKFPDATDAAALARRVMAGDAVAESKLALAYRESVLQFLRARVRHKDAAEELADEVLMTAILALRQGRVRQPEFIGAFVHGIAVHAASGYLRAKFKQPVWRALDYQLEDAKASAALGRTQDREALDTAIVCFNVLDQRILRLLLDEGMNEIEAARRMGMTSVALRQRKSRMVRKLASLLGQHE